VVSERILACQEHSVSPSDEELSLGVKNLKYLLSTLRYGDGHLPVIVTKRLLSGKAEGTMSIHDGEVDLSDTDFSSEHTGPLTPNGPGANTQYLAGQHWPGADVQPTPTPILLPHEPSFVAGRVVANRRRHVRVGWKKLGVVVLLAGVVALGVNDLGERGHVSNANREISRLSNANHELSSLRATVASDRLKLASDDATITRTRAALAAQTSAASSLKAQLQAETKQVAQVEAQLAQANQRAAVASQQAQAAALQAQAPAQQPGTAATAPPPPSALAQLQAWETNSFTPAMKQLTSDTQTIASDIQMDGTQGAQTEFDGKLMAQYATADISSSVAPNANVEAAWRTFLQENVAEGQATAAGNDMSVPAPDSLPLEKAMNAAGLSL
jgi:hypothetical protein